jgi:hypothetical protein
VADDGELIKRGQRLRLSENEARFLLLAGEIEERKPRANNEKKGHISDVEND